MKRTPLKRKPAKKRPKRNYSTRSDVVFSKIIRARGRCEHCDGTDSLQCAHGFSRRYRNTRWDERNAFALCAKDHMKFTYHPIAWDDWLRDKWGDDLYTEMRALAQSTEKVDTKAVLERLTRRWAQIESTGWNGESP